MDNDGGHFRDAAIDVARDLQLNNLIKGDKSERRAAVAYYKRDFQYVLLAAAIAFFFIGVLSYLFGILGWAFIPFFAIPFMFTVYRMIKGRDNMDAHREEQMKTHMMMKGDKRYWGRGEVDEK